ncbi:MAG: DUF4915 domain-containing protein [Coleofasciculus sp. G1-WW12-02]
MPQVNYVTGDLDVHDVAVVDPPLLKGGLGGDHPIFVNTLFSCLATVSETHSFTPVWQPPFISKPFKL